MKEQSERKQAVTMGVLFGLIVLLTAIIVGLSIALMKTKKEESIEKQHSAQEQETQQQETTQTQETTKTSQIRKSDSKITVVPTMNDTITADSSWCGTFQLVWNDMKKELVGGDVVFISDPELAMVKNLNKEDFNESMISDQYYFKIYGLKTLELKKQIEDGIKAKFNQTSDILDDFDWSEDGLDNPNDPDVSRYFFYTMLYRKFEFLNEFDKLDNGKFAKKYENVKYFGIDSNTKEVGGQIKVLYYNSKEDFAIAITTKTYDDVIFCKNPEGKTFNEIYDNMNKKANSYTGSISFKNVDEFKAPNLEFNEKREYTELEKKIFNVSGGTAEIEKAIQTVKFSVDEKGGEIKSEAAFDIVKSGASSLDFFTKPDEPRYFYLDDTFAIFLREKGKTMPYFAGMISDITKFQ